MEHDKACPDWSVTERRDGARETSGGSDIPFLRAARTDAMLRVLRVAEKGIQRTTRSLPKGSDGPKQKKGADNSLLLEKN